MSERKDYPNCLYTASGCPVPWNCKNCGFDRDEAERRRAIPLTPNCYGLLRKNIGRSNSESGASPSPASGASGTPRPTPAAPSPAGGEKGNTDCHTSVRAGSQ